MDYLIWLEIFKGEARLALSPSVVGRLSGQKKLGSGEKGLGLGLSTNKGKGRGKLKENMDKSKGHVSRPELVVFSKGGLHPMWRKKPIGLDIMSNHKLGPRVC